MLKIEGFLILIDFLQISLMFVLVKYLNICA